MGENDSTGRLDRLAIDCSECEVTTIVFPTTLKAAGLDKGRVDAVMLAFLHGDALFTCARCANLR